MFSKKKILFPHFLYNVLLDIHNIKNYRSYFNFSIHFSTKIENKEKVKDVNKKKLEEIKVSKECSYNALFDECLEKLYKMKREIDKESVEYEDSEIINELNKEELKITKNIFDRIDKKNVSNLTYKDIYIDPYWNPFKEIDDLKREITFEFNDYAKMVSIVELKKQKRAIKKTLKEQYRLNNPYSNKHQYDIEENIDKNEKYWNPSFHKKKILTINAPFIWRHTHILHNFIGENGLILPRKINLTTRKQQIQIFKAICITRRMALYPYDIKPKKDDLIPFMDPLQFFLDELIHRYKEYNDLRAQAIIKVMINKYDSLNYYKYFCYESKKNKDNEIKKEREKQEEKGDFSHILKKYKTEYYKNVFNY